MVSTGISRMKYVTRIIFLIIISIGLLMHIVNEDLAGIINGLSYFTIISNIMCFAVMFYAVVRKKCHEGKKFSIFYGGALLSITLTFFVYSFVLANSDFTMRAMKTVTFDSGDILVHYLVPAIMWIDFVWIMPHKLFDISYITIWLSIPVVYLIVTMVKASAYSYFDVSSAYKKYPYDFLNVEVNGLPYLVSYIGLFTLLCIAIGLVICMLDFVGGMFYTKKVYAHTNE